MVDAGLAKGGYHNANALRFEDMKGQEQLWLHAEPLPVSSMSPSQSMAQLSSQTFRLNLTV
ncbi:bacteriophage T4 gp5 trimerisation domain-containing protein [Herbaspirillum rubrisubalbicans]|uniref:bacteriophage T4 gp5 trimerisation domain-containing protein n=1 Tax=Herbaspirillum rubrisubalbicans TaxID=80842 RepID=UPI0015C55658|nr:hypothetical protein [Herbaspirillum rubrisubalbicans]NQE47456.1 hypothetical protein [Herbaspirillum rubrisubalbicans]